MNAIGRGNGRINVRISFTIQRLSLYPSYIQNVDFKITTNKFNRFL